MTRSSNRLESTFSPEIEEQIRGRISRVIRFKAEADGILSKYRPVPVVRKDPSQLLENIFSRFHAVAKEINERYASRPTLRIKDKYDVQDLMRRLLRLYSDDVRPEEWTPSYAGASARMDFLLKKDQIVIEVKMTRKGLRDAKIGEQIIVDKAHYERHPDCKLLYCLIYDPDERLSNPAGLERDLGGSDGEFQTRVFVVPRRA